MEELFVKEILIHEVRNIKEFRIPLDDQMKRHLIITGKNGSGKTSLLTELRQFLNSIPSGQFTQYESIVTQLKALKAAKERIPPAEVAKEAEKSHNLDSRIASHENWIRNLGGTKMEFNSPWLTDKYYKAGEFVIAFFGAKRNTTLKTPTGINKFSMASVYQIEANAGNEFIQYIVNLKADRSFAKDENDNVTVRRIDDWFESFERDLFKLFDTKDISLKFDRKQYNFNVVENGKAPYNLNQLSDGYSAILNIVTELIMRMEEHHSKSYDVQGIVLIDEIETHLHVELQKKVLPFLISFFPRVQFIVTTHSPFVISSIENAVICDLEKRIITRDLTGYSYDTIIESYFDSDKYSSELKNRIEQYEALKGKEILNEDEREKLLSLKTYLNEIPKFISDELAVKLQQIKLKELNKKLL